MIEKRIPDFEDYFVTDAGEVISYKFGKRRIMKLNQEPTGYRSIGLRKNGRKITWKIHRLVLTVFVCRCPNGKEANHINGDKSDNSLANLEWVTREENMQHAYDKGLKIPPRGTSNGLAKLNPQKVLEIIELLDNGVMQKDIAPLYGIAKSSVSAINLGRTWSHLTGRGVA